MTPAENHRLTRVGPGTPMGDYLRRYWMPVAGVAQLDETPVMPLRVFGEDLVLFRTRSGEYGLVERHCSHRRADLAHGMVEARGLRCHYHGWLFDVRGHCVARPYEDVSQPGKRAPEGTHLRAWPVAAKAGLLWAYLGPEPAPLLPDWEPFSRRNVFVQVVISQIPCNWLQCQENSIDPVHFEWMHENWGNRLRDGVKGAMGPPHLRLRFEEFEFGFRYQRLREGTDPTHPLWQVGRVCLWPNAFFLGEHFEWRVPIDDENTLSVVWKATRVPRDCEPYEQKRVPAWVGPIYDNEGRLITSHVMNQDFVAWIGQGRIADRSREHLGASDQGIVLYRRRLQAELDNLAQGGEPKGLIRDPLRNQAVVLPVADTESAFEGYTRQQILADPVKRMRFLSYMFQAGQPQEVQEEFAEAMRLRPEEFRGIQPAFR